MIRRRFTMTFRAVTAIVVGAVLATTLPVSGAAAATEDSEPVVILERDYTSVSPAQCPLIKISAEATRDAVNVTVDASALFSISRLKISGVIPSSDDPESATHVDFVDFAQQGPMRFQWFKRQHNLLAGTPGFSESASIPIQRNGSYAITASAAGNTTDPNPPNRFPICDASARWIVHKIAVCEEVDDRIDDDYPLRFVTVPADFLASAATSLNPPLADSPAQKLDQDRKQAARAGVRSTRVAEAFGTDLVVVSHLAPLTGWQYGNNPFVSSPKLTELQVDENLYAEVSEWPALVASWAVTFEDRSPRGTDKPLYDYGKVSLPVTLDKGAIAQVLDLDPSTFAQESCEVSVDGYLHVRHQPWMIRCYQHGNLCYVLRRTNPAIDTWEAEQDSIQSVHQFLNVFSLSAAAQLLGAAIGRDDVDEAATLVQIATEIEPMVEDGKTPVSLFTALYQSLLPVPGWEVANIDGYPGQIVCAVDRWGRKARAKEGLYPYGYGPPCGQEGMQPIWPPGNSSVWLEGGPS